MERDDFTCRACEATHKTLNVHHLFYAPNRDPWEYPDRCLVTFCKDCHKKEEELKVATDENFARFLRRLGATNAQMDRIAYLIHDISKCVGPDAALSVVENALDEAISRNNNL